MTDMKQIHFFAAQNDLISVLGAIENNFPLKYVPMGQFLRPNIEEFKLVSDIPNLGHATTESASSSQSFLVTKYDIPIITRNIQTRFGVRYVVDQLINPDTVVFSPGGSWGDGVILNGRVATVSDSPVAQDLMRRFKKRLRGNFRKIRAFLVGPAAEILLDKGLRLTAAAESPREFDLVREAPESELR